MADHTPTPWIAASKFSSVAGVPVVAQTGESICNTSLPGLPEDWPDHRKQRSEANAAFIVKAVNSHDALVKALTKARARIEYLGAACTNEKHFVSNERDFLPEIDAALQEAGR